LILLLKEEANKVIVFGLIYELAQYKEALSFEVGWKNTTSFNI